MNTSELFKIAILNVYKQGIYTVDYAIIQTEALRSRNRLTEEDYMELLTYLAGEQSKKIVPEVEESSAENSENSVESSAESAENTAEEELSSEESEVEE